jgi:hypothetical protein
MKPFLFIGKIILITAIFYFISSGQPAFGQYSFVDTDEKEHASSCKGYYSLTTDSIRKDQSSGSKWILRDKYNNSIILDYSNYDWGWATGLRLYKCVDIDKDGQLEAVLEFYSGGVHCCYKYFIYKKERSGLGLMESISLGNASRPVFKDINNDGAVEILTINDSLDSFGGLCHACSPFFPLIICYSNNVFIDCTFKFPELIDDEIQKTLKEKGSIDDDWKGIALKYLVLHIIKGKEKEGWQGVKKYYPQTYSWLKKHSKEIGEKLNKNEFNKRKGTVSFK